MAATEIPLFELNTRAKIPSLGIGTWQAAPGVVADAVTTAVKVFSFHLTITIYNGIYGSS